jgi:protein-tyrosine-phosphatase
MPEHYNVTFLCTGNSARSIMAEAIMNHKGRLNFTAYSAGSHPSGIVRPEALKQIEAAGLSTEGLYSKSWMNSPSLAHPYSISSLQSAITLPRKSARFGLDSP